jgi:transcriptional regulator with GAF, ATPase, and Fis domain
MAERAIHNAARTHATNRDSRILMASGGSASIAPTAGRLIGRSAAIRAIEDEIDSAARSDAKVLITGETGVGKAVVARLIHHQSRRAAAPVVRLNCAGLPDVLLESELFGHVRGSFTGAYRDKPGLLELAANGTVFLDDIALMSTRLQVVLLRFLESGEIQRVGADRVHRRVNVRVVAATNRDLQAPIASGTFRQDLYFRLHTTQLAVPPLRERTEDIPLLVEFFLQAYARGRQTTKLEVSSEALEALVAYRWPGNVGELRQVVERIALLARRSVARLDDLPVEISHTNPQLADSQRPRGPKAVLRENHV